MPATKCVIGTDKNPRLKYSIEIPGPWDEVSEDVRAAWNRATPALGDLAELFLKEEDREGN